MKNVTSEGLVIFFHIWNLNEFKMAKILLLKIKHHGEEEENERALMNRSIFSPNCCHKRLVIELYC